WRDGVDVGRVGRKRDIGARTARQINEALEQEMSTFRPLPIKYGLERLKPLLRFEGLVVAGTCNCTGVFERGHSLSPVGVIRTALTALLLRALYQVIPEAGRARTCAQRSLRFSPF